MSLEAQDTLEIMDLAATGIYTDRLQKVDGVWKFVYRKLVIDPTWKS